MPSTQPKLEYGCFYHVYNRGINGCPLFHHSDNYEHFLRLYDKYISPVADTYAWVLMGNHFHLLIKVKLENEISFIPPKSKTPEGLTDASGSSGAGQKISAPERPERVLKPKKYKPTNQFSHLFNAYAKSFNKRFKRSGSLFEHPFERVKITTNAQLKYLVYYIHHNPVHHGFCDEMVEYPWSSYLTILSPKQTRLKRSEVLKWYINNQHFNPTCEKCHPKNQKMRKFQLFYFVTI
jgi:hypothetical protein